jgi:hypothetical protein
MQKAHMRQFDFTRFTYLGHRRLFRYFEQVDGAISCGPGMALADSVIYFLLSFTESHLARNVMTAAGRLATFWLKYVDYYLASKEGAYDAASAFYFLGRKSGEPVSDREILRQYRGGGNC